MSNYQRVWESIDETVARGRMPGAVAGIRQQGVSEFHASGRLALDSDRPMLENTPFRIASLSKPFSAVLTAFLLQDGIFELDEPVSPWLPELAEPRVLLDPEGPLNQTVPADSAITVRQLLDSTFGAGVIFGNTPLSQAVQAAGIGAGTMPPNLSADEYLARFSELPLSYQPGSRWMYNTSADLLSILLSRVTGKSLSELLRQRITEPLGMSSTAFYGRAEELPVQYLPSPDGLQVVDLADGRFSRQPKFETLAGGLVSTVPDYLKFFSALADGQLLPEEYKSQMVSNQLTDAQRATGAPIIGPSNSWGWQIGVNITADENSISAGSYGWTGGSGTSAVVDPGRELIGVVFSQRAMAGPDDNFNYFWAPLAEQ